MRQPSEGLRLKKKKSHSESTPGQKNVALLALGDKSKICLPPLHIKVGLLKISVKAMDEKSERFAYIKQTFPIINEAKLKEGFFIGPQMTQLFEDQYLVQH